MVGVKRQQSLLSQTQELQPPQEASALQPVTYQLEYEPRVSKRIRYSGGSSSYSHKDDEKESPYTYSTSSEHPVATEYPPSHFEPLPQENDNKQTLPGIKQLKLSGAAVYKAREWPPQELTPSFPQRSPLKVTQIITPPNICATLPILPLPLPSVPSVPSALAHVNVPILPLHAPILPPPVPPAPAYPVQTELIPIKTDKGGIIETTFASVPVKKAHKRRPANMDKESLYCHSCGSKNTPEWRRGPKGPATLCNACGLAYAKRLRQEEEAKAAPTLPLIPEQRYEDFSHNGYQTHNSMPSSISMSELYQHAGLFNPAPSYQQPYQQFSISPRITPSRPMRQAHTFHHYVPPATTTTRLVSSPCPSPIFTSPAASIASPAPPSQTTLSPMFSMMTFPNAIPQVPLSEFIINSLVKNDSHFSSPFSNPTNNNTFQLAPNFPSPPPSPIPALNLSNQLSSPVLPCRPQFFLTSPPLAPQAGVPQQ